jgi:fructuronate reductase
VRIVHLGLGNFFRAHQAWYTEHGADAPDWGIAAFGGRSAEPARTIAGQDGLYTLVARGPDTDRFEVVGTLSSAYGGQAHRDWLDHVASADVAVLTVTVTEAGYHARARGDSTPKILPWGPT